jgi:hypothetical protein
MPPSGTPFAFSSMAARINGPDRDKPVALDDMQPVVEIDEGAAVGCHQFDFGAKRWAYRDAGGARPAPIERPRVMTFRARPASPRAQANNELHNSGPLEPWTTRCEPDMRLCQIEPV